jgi:hypothetical protein
MTNDKLDAMKQDYRDIFESTIGRRVLEDLEKFCGFKKISVCEQSPNAMQTMFTEGKRRVYLRILSMMEKQDERRQMQK